MSGCRLPSRCPTLLEKVPIQDGDTASFYVDASGALTRSIDLVLARRPPRLPFRRAPGLHHGLLEIIEDGHLLLRADQSHHQASRIGQHGKPVIQCVARGGIHQIECFSGFVRLPELSGTDTRRTRIPRAQLSGGLCRWSGQWPSPGACLGIFCGWRCSRSWIGYSGEPLSALWQRHEAVRQPAGFESN